MDAKSLATLDEVVGGACVALFESAGIPLEPVPAAPEPIDDIGASIGFTGVLRGALVLVSTRELIRQALPADVRDGAGDAQIADWMGELSNQLLGRIKNKLLAYGVTLEMSTPTVMFGVELARKDTRSTVRRSFKFRHAGQPLGVVLDAMTAPEFVLAELENPPGGIPEGELALF